RRWYSRSSSRTWLITGRITARRRGCCSSGSAARPVTWTSCTTVSGGSSPGALRCGKRVGVPPGGDGGQEGGRHRTGTDPVSEVRGATRGTDQGKERGGRRFDVTFTIPVRSTQQEARQG